ncbi:hypothetical protein RZS08_58485, partial [Arthrospira platensis SPKY1]|nr:hypothetical protein [Arthrospira platensis SPKY1]
LTGTSNFDTATNEALFLMRKNFTLLYDVFYLDLAGKVMLESDPTALSNKLRDFLSKFAEIITGYKSDKDGLSDILAGFNNDNNLKSSIQDLSIIVSDTPPKTGRSLLQA